MTNITQLLEAIDQGQAGAADKLLSAVYGELHRLASAKMAREKPGQTLQPTVLVHDAWLKLAGSNRPSWQNRKHFFGAAAEAMRRILIDRARKRRRSRHGRGLERIDLDHIDIAAESDDDTLLAVDEALTRLANESPERAELVRLRYYAGMSLPEAAVELGISESTAKRRWNYIRAWLFRELKNSLR